MKIHQYILAAASALVLPIAVHAQEAPSTVTRAQVRAELVQLERAGYRPEGNDPYYPTDIQAAESKVHAEEVASANGRGGIGGINAGTSQTGSRIAIGSSTGTLFSHH